MKFKDRRHKNKRTFHWYKSHHKKFNEPFDERNEPSEECIEYTARGAERYLILCSSGEYESLGEGCFHRKRH